jgi:hypothetical protein
VRGSVIDEAGCGVAGISVIAVDRDLRREQELGRAVTDQSGYDFGYPQRSFVRADKGSADLVVRVVGSVGALLAESPVRPNNLTARRHAASIKR